MMKVELLDHMGSDLAVVNAARVSFDKESDWEIYRSDIGHGNAREDLILSKKDTKLIHYLAKHNHWSPFAHCFLQFRIEAPIFVSRQLGKHQVGLSWNEVSRRYVDSDPEFYVPERWRLRAENVKQGSSNIEYEGDVGRGLSYQQVLEQALDTYKYMINELNIAPEQARMILPQSMITKWIWSGSLMAFARVCNLRLDPHSQKETQEIAKEIARHCKKLFPISFEALVLPGWSG